MGNQRNHVIIHAVTVRMRRDKKPREEIINRVSKNKVIVTRKLYPKLKNAKNVAKFSILAKNEFFLSNDKEIVSGRHQPGSKLKVLAQDFLTSTNNSIVDACNEEIMQELKKFAAGKEHKTYFVFERVPKAAIKWKRSAKMKAVA